ALDGYYVRREFPQPLAARADRLAHAAQVEVLQVAESAVNRAQAVRGGTRAEIRPVHERHAQAASGGLPRDRDTVDSAADHGEVEGFCREPRQSLRTLHQ